MKSLEAVVNGNNIHSDVNTIKLVIDLENHCLNGIPHPGHDPGIIIYYLIKVNDQKYETKKPSMLGRELIELDGKHPDDFLLYQTRHKHGEIYLEPIGKNEVVDFKAEGIEGFVTKPKTYHFTIGKKEYESVDRKLTVRQILVDFAHVDPNSNTLSTKQGHEYKSIDEVIDLECTNHFILFNDEPTPVS
jgi:hypothetical protein